MKSDSLNFTSAGSRSSAAKYSLSLASREAVTVLSSCGTDCRDIPDIRPGAIYADTARKKMAAYM